MKRGWTVLALVLAFGAGTAPAQQTNDQAQQAVARAQALLRQLAQEKAAVEAEVNKLRAENAKLKKTGQATAVALEARSADLAAAMRETGGVRASLARKAQRLERVTGQLREVVAKYKEQAAVLRQTEAERGELQATLAQTERQLEDAEQKNLALYRLNREILEEFEQEGSWDGLLRKEPFTGLKRVQIENLVQDYDHEMGEQLRESTLKQLAAPAAQ